MIYKKASRKKAIVIALLFLFIASAIAAIVLSAPPAASAATNKDLTPSTNATISLGGRITVINGSVVPKQQLYDNPFAAGPHVVQTQDYNYKISTHEITTSNSYIYVTPAGNYAFSSLLPWAMSYTPILGNQTQFSSYGITEGQSGVFLTPSTSVVTVGQSNYAINTTLTTGQATHGYLYCAYDFSQTPEETTCKYSRANGAPNFSIIEMVSGNYLTVDGKTTQNANGQTRLVALGSYTNARLGNTNDASKWKNVLRADWSKFGQGSVSYGKFDLAGSTYYGVVVEFPSNVATVDPSIVQINACGTYVGSGNNLGNVSCSFGSNVTSGDLLLVGAGFYDTVTNPTSISIVSDSQSLTWTGQGSLASGQIITEFFTATASSTGAETITVGDGLTNNAGNGLQIYEISGLMTSGASDTTGSGTSVSFAAASLSFSSGYIFATIAMNSGDGITAGSSFTALQPASGQRTASGEYSTTVGSPTTCPASDSTSSSVTWVEVCLNLPILTVTQPTVCTMDNSASAVTVTISGGTPSPSPSNVLCDGLSHNVVVVYSTTITATEPADGATDRQRFGGGGGTTSVVSCSSGTCGSWSFTNYDERKNTLGFSLSVGTTTSGLTWTYTGYVDSSTSATVCTDSPSSGVSSDSQATCWSNYNRAITAPAEPSGEASNERFRNSADGTSTAGTPTTGGNTYTTTYYRQEDTTYQISTNGQGPPTWDSGLSVAFTGTYLGTGSTTICTSSPTSGTTTTTACTGGHTGWADYNTAVTIASLMSGAGSNIQWKVYGTASWTETSAGNTVTATEYKQLQNTYAANAYSPTTFSASITFTVTGTIGGTGSSTVCTISVPASPSAGSYNCSGYADYNLAVSLPSQSGNNPSNIAWVKCTSGCTNTVFSWTDTTGGNTHTGDYKQDFTNTYNANPFVPTTFSGSITFAVTGTIGGATGQTVCTVSVPASPSSGAYGCTGPTDTGTAATIAATSGSNPANVRWQVSGTNSWSDSSGGNTHTANYYEQLQNTYQITPNAQTTWDSGLTSQTAVGTYLGTGSSTICTISLPNGGGAQSCTSWADYNLAVVIGVSTIGGAPANSQWLRSGACSFTQTSGGNTNNCNYYKQWTNTFQYSVTYGGSPSAPTLSCNELGSTATLGLTTSPQPFYCDHNAAATSTNPINGVANEQWSDNAQSFTITTGGGANTFVYYHQYDQTLSYSVVDGGSPTAPTGTGTEFGSSYTPSLTTTATKYWFDVTGSITFTNPLSSSTSTERWKTTTTSLSATSIGTAAPAYYHQWKYQFAYSITDGGSGYSAPTLTITYIGTGGNTSTLSTSYGTVYYWVDSTTAAASTNPLTGSGSSERWFTGTASVTVSSSSTYTFAYYHQYLQTYSYTLTGGAGSSSAPTFTYTYLGAGGQTQTASTTPATQFVDSTTSWTFTNPLTGSGSSERWDANSGTSGTVSSAATLNPSYYHQYAYTVSYTVSGGGAPTAPQYSCLQFGSTLTYTLTGSGTVEWSDSSCSYSFTNPAQLIYMPTSNTNKERWFTGITTTGTVSSAQTIAATYYNQYWFNNTALTLTYVYTGATQPASVYQGWVDAGSSLTVAGVYSHVWTVKTQGSLYQTSNGVQYYGNHTLTGFAFTTIPLQVTFTGTKANATQWVSTQIAMTVTRVTDNGNSISFTTTVVGDGTIYKFVGSSSFVVVYSSNGITSVTISNPIYQPEQTKTVAALSYFWAFYCDGTNINMRTAADGITWSASTTIAACVNGQRFSVAISGTTLIYSRVDETGNVYYRAGTISISSGAGVVTWLAAEQTAVSGTSGTFGNNGALTNAIALSGTCYYASFTAPSPVGILSQLSVGLSDTSAASYSVSVGVYSNAGSLLASGTATVSVGTSAAYVTIPFSTDLYLASSTAYWLAVTTPASSMSLYASATTGGTSKYQSSCTSLPSSIGTTTSATNVVDIYGTWYQFNLPFAAIDTNSYSWISYSKWDGTNYLAFATESQATNGVWATVGGFPKQLATTTSSPYATEIAPITAGKVVAIWSQTGQKLTVSVWAGGAWSSNYQNTNTLVSLYYFSAQTSFDAVNIAFLWNNGGTYTVQIARFFYSPIGFIADATLSTTATTATSAPVIFKSSATGNYNIFYVGSGNTVYIVPFSAAAAIGTPKLIFTDANTITNNDQIDAVPLGDATNRAGFMFLENTVSPWKLQYLVVYFSAQFSLILNPDVGSLSVNATNYFTVTYTLNGATQTLQYTGTPNSVPISADAGSTVTISGSTSLSNTAKEVWWFQTSGASISFTAANNTVSYIYYDMLAQVAKYAIVGGGAPSAPTLTYVTVPSSASAVDSPLTTVYTLTTSSTTVYITRASTANATPQLNGVTGEIWTPAVASWKIASFNQIPIPINYYHQYQIGASYKVLFGGIFTAPTFSYVSDAVSKTLILTTSNQNVYIDVSSAWSVTSPLAGTTGTERATTSPSSGTITAITAYVFTYTHQFGVQFKFSVLPNNGVVPSYSGAPTLTVIQNQASTVISLTTSFVTTWVDAGTEWKAQNPWVSGANSFNPTTVGGIIAAQGSISNTNPITIYYGLAPRCIGNNTTLLAEEGCFFPAIFYVFANIMGPFFAGLTIAGLCMAVYIKTENGILAVFLFFISAIVLGALFPPIFGQAILIGLAALVTYAIYESIRSGQ